LAIARFAWTGQKGVEAVHRSGFSVPKGSRFSTWLADEFRPGQLTKSVTAALLNYLMEIIVVISFAALIFSGELASQVPHAIGLLVIGDAIVCLVVTLLSSYRGSIAIEQDAPAAILAIAAASVVSAMPAEASVEQKFSTVVVLMVLTTLVTGVCFMLLGRFRLGGLARFLPYPVMGGFIAGTGWLLTAGGVSVMSGVELSPMLFRPELLIRWAPGVALGVVLLLALNRSNSPLLLPGIIAGAVVLFYAMSWLTGNSVAELSAQGRLLAPIQTGALWQFPLSASRLAEVDWSVIASHIGTVAPILVVSVISLLLNASGLELVVGQDIDLNRELGVTGFANLLASLGGGIVGYHAISLSTLNHTTSGGKRLAGLLIAAALALTLFAGAALFSYVPTMIVGGLLVFLGLSLLTDWVYRAWTRFTKVEFLILLGIVAVIATRGFLEGIAIGVGATVILFVISYSRVNVVKHRLSGSCYRSRVTRSPAQRGVLDVRGDQLYILQLQGFIFFGTANGLFEQLSARTRNADVIPLRFCVFDFAQVTGIDSTALLSFTKIRQLTRGAQVILVLTGLSPGMCAQFAAGGLTEEPAALRIFPDLDHGVEWCEDEIIAAAQLGQGVEMALQSQLEAILPGTMRAAVTRLMRHLNRRDVATGEYLIRQDDEADTIFFIEIGQVTAQLEVPGRAPVRLETMRGGRTIGELGFYLGIRRTAAVVADEPGTVYTLSKRELEHVEKTDPEAAFAFHRIIVHLLGERVVHLIRAVDALQE
jgi:sulfate permease, SulP family